MLSLLSCLHAVKENLSAMGRVYSSTQGKRSQRLFKLGCSGAEFLDQ